MRRMFFFASFLLVFVLFSVPFASADETSDQSSSGPIIRSLALPPLSPSSPPSTGNIPQLPPLGEAEPTPGVSLPSIGGESSAPQPPVSGPIIPGVATPAPAPIPVQPPVAAPTVQWKQLDLGQNFSFDPLIKGVVEYPANWSVYVDTFNRSVTFSEDQGGTVAFTAFLATQSNIQNAEALAQQIESLLAQMVQNLVILNQEFKSDPGVAQAGMSLTSGRVILQGNYQGRTFTFLLQPYVLYIPVGGMSYHSALLCQAPQEVFQEKLQTYFNHLITSFEATAK